MYFYIFLAALLIMSASLVGVFTLNAFVGSFIKTKLPFLVSFSAGVFLFTSGFMIMESLHVLDNTLLAGVLVVAGFIAARMTTYLFPEFHHHHDKTCHTHGSRNKIMTGDAIHNIADGLILVPAFLISPWLGVGTAVSIFIHELLQELSEFFVLQSMGYSVRQTLIYNVLVSSTILLGVGIGLVVADTVILQGALLAFSAGFFINIVLFDLIPHTTHHPRMLGKELIIHLILVVLGIVLMVGINQLFTHDHDHTEEFDVYEHTHTEE